MIPWIVVVVSPSWIYFQRISFGCFCFIGTHQHVLFWKMIRWNATSDCQSLSLEFNTLRKIIVASFKRIILIRTAMTQMLGKNTLDKFILLAKLSIYLKIYLTFPECKPLSNMNIFVSDWNHILPNHQYVKFQLSRILQDL